MAASDVSGHDLRGDRNEPQEAQDCNLVYEPPWVELELFEYARNMLSENQWRDFFRKSHASGSVVSSR